MCYEATKNKYFSALQIIKDLDSNGIRPSSYQLGGSNVHSLTDARTGLLPTPVTLHLDIHNRIHPEKHIYKK